jgi:magnesium chelatase family protein
LSGPLRDRIDLVVQVPPLSTPELCDTTASGEPSAEIRARVIAARDRQRARLLGSTVRANAALEGRLLRRHCRLDDRTRQLLARASARFCLSARAHDRVLRVARTIADLAGREAIGVEDVAEALQFREVSAG